MVLSNDPHAFGLQRSRHPEPRASLVPAGLKIETQVWVGGADTVLGEPLTRASLTDSWLVDCAGELPAELRAAAAGFHARVFADIEAVPSSLDSILALARDLARRLADGGGPGATTPARLYVLCSQGFNRSGLMAGLILRELGLPAARAVDLIRAARPGSLSNETFVRLLLG